MKTFKIRYYIRSLQTFAVVEAETAQKAIQQVRDSNPRFAGVASVEVVETENKA